MEAFPAGSLDHNIPLLVVSGLSTGPTKPLLSDAALREGGTLIRSELPPIDSREAKTILRYIQDADGPELPWNQQYTRRYRFKVETIGREFLLPPRNARLPEDVEAPQPPTVLYSPFSPLSPGSTLYPDGIIDSRWIWKHQTCIPSIFLCFYNLASDPNLATLNDNQLKTDINDLRYALSLSRYKCRFVAVILSDESPNAMDAYQERLDNIRRSTGLDPKASLFVIPTQRSEPDLEAAVDSVLTAVFAQATEYYRDLGRHARKKKGRGTVPQPTIPPTNGTSHTLSLQGWNVRYDFKAGIFAEFRQEMDSALRSYEQAYETLLSSDVLESVPSWSPKFNDGRLLADVIAFRALRCLLWTGQSTAAVRRWQYHRDRISDLVERHGSGTQNYGWAAWESRWAELMAQLVEKVRYPELEASSFLLFRPPEKILSAERLQPWELLHHPGYWYRTAAQHTLDRRKFAWAIPEEDRRAPDTSTESKAATTTYKAYDTYLCPEPYEEYPSDGNGTNHAQIILNYLSLARAEFQKRRQPRIAAEVALDCARELERLGDWDQIIELLTPLWRNMPFRTESWVDIAEGFCWILRKAAVEAGKAELVIAIDWELLDSSFTRIPQWHYDLSKSLVDVTVDHHPEVDLHEVHHTSCLSSSFSFKNEEGRAGQACPAQLAITSAAFAQSPPLVFQEIRVDFEGSIRPLILTHQEASIEASAETNPVAIVPLTELESASEDPEDEDSESSSQQNQSIVLAGNTNLTIRPGQTRVFQVDIPLREAGDARAAAVRVTLAPEAFTLRYSMGIPDSHSAVLWYGPGGRTRTMRLNPHHIKVLPRPPKMQVKFVGIFKQYYAGEPMQIDVEMVNEEDVDAITRLDMHLYGQDAPSFKAQSPNEPQKANIGGGEETKLVGLPVGSIASSQSKRATITIDPVNKPAAYDLTVKAVYNLVSDPATPIVQSISLQLNIVNPFEASYDLIPRLHDDAWPSLFDHKNIDDLSDEDDTSSTIPKGLAQKWCLITRFGSFAAEELIVNDLDVKVVGSQGGVECTATKKHELAPHGLTMAPNTMEEAQFDLVAQKHDLDDRNAATADLAFIIKWNRASSIGKSGDDVHEDEKTSVPPNTTTFFIDPFYVIVTEPRVLGAVSYSSIQEAGSQLIVLDITIENPSSHFLTFGLTMEPSDDFAFSGAKTTTLNVLPVSRRRVTYRLLPLKRGLWIRPLLVVRDKYFQKVLKIIPTEGMKRDAEGVLIWVPERGGEEENESVEEGETAAAAKNAEA